jgi:glucose-1-phosphatase
VIEVIVSDLGQVLLKFDTEPGWRELEAACPECKEFRSIFRTVFGEAEMGRGVTDPEEFYRRLIHATGLRLPFPEFCRIWCDQFWEDDETISLIMNAPVGERHLLSNTNVIHWDWIQEKHGDLIYKFDRIWLSHELGLEKPDPAIYQRVIDATGLLPEVHLFIDDIPENVQAAQAVGMQGIVHTDANALAQELARLDLLPEPQRIV